MRAENEENSLRAANGPSYEFYASKNQWKTTATPLGLWVLILTHSHIHAPAPGVAGGGLATQVDSSVSSGEYLRRWLVIYRRMWLMPAARCRKMCCTYRSILQRGHSAAARIILKMLELFLFMDGRQRRRCCFHPGVASPARCRQDQVTWVWVPGINWWPSVFLLALTHYCCLSITPLLSSSAWCFSCDHSQDY